MELIERLRTFGAYAMDEDGNMSEFHPNALTTAAADEIERLRSALDAEGNDTNLLMLEIERLRDALANARTGAALLALERKQELVEQLADALWAQAGVKDGTLHPLTDIALAAYEESRHDN